MAIKKTEEEYIVDLQNKNPDVELVGHYINNHTKVAHRCKIHNIVWDIDPNHALRGHGCCECAQERKVRTRIKPTEEYIAELEIKNPTIKLKGEYKNNRTPTLHYCEIHKIDFNIRPYDALCGKGCNSCRPDKIRAAFLKSGERYVAELAIKNPTVKLIGEYLGTDTPTLHRCIIHDVLWNMAPSNALYGKGCWQCRSEKISNSLRKSEEEYAEELADINPLVKLVGKYINAKTPVQHYCKKHDVLFNISPACALRGCGCRQCGSEKLSMAMTKPEEQYIADLAKVNSNIVLIGRYMGSDVNTPHKCMVCGCEWSPRPGNILSGCGCPECNESKGERQIALWLKQNKIIYNPQKRFDNCRDVKPLPFDFYLPDNNICIEYQGMQHYEAIDFFGGEKSLKYMQYHDEIKKQYCIDNSIGLICIPYWENIEQYLDKNLLI